jgi:hypothetical protein
LIPGAAARLASEGDDNGNEEWISPRRLRRGVDPPEAGKKSGVSARTLPTDRCVELGGSICELRLLRRGRPDEGAGLGDEVGKCNGEETDGAKQ